MRQITPEILLKAYALGVFPMAESRYDPTLYWVDPEERGVLPLEHFHVPHKIRRLVRKDIFSVKVNTAFRDVVMGCAESTPGRPSTWINDTVIASNAGGRTSWSAAYMASVSARRFSAKACFPGNPQPAKSLSCTWSHG